MKIIKIILWLLLAIMIAVALLVGVGLNSEKFLNLATKEAIDKLGLDISYKSLRGGLYSGLELEGFSYQEGNVSGDIKVDVDIQALSRGKLHVRDINLSHLHLDKAFLESMLVGGESNKSASKKSDFLKEVQVDRLHFDTEDIHYQEYALHSLVLDVKDFKTQLDGKFYGDIEAKVDSNVAKADLSASLDGEHYDATIDAQIEPAFVTPYLKESNVTIGTMPPLHLEAKGDMKQAKVNLVLGAGELLYTDIPIQTESLSWDGDVGIKSGDVDAIMIAKVASPYAKVALDLKHKLNIHDINETLDFQLHSTILPEPSYAKEILADQNITFSSLPTLFVDAKGDMKKVHLQSHTQKGDFAYGEYTLLASKIELDALLDVTKKDLDTSFLTHLDSNVAKIRLKSKASVNLEDINNSLHYQSEGEIQALTTYLKKRMPDANLTLQKLSPLTLMIKGDAKQVDANLALDGEMTYQDISLKPRIEKSFFHMDLQSKEVKSHLLFDLASNKGNSHLDADVALNLNDINQSLRYTIDADVKDAKPFMGVDLSELGDISLQAKGDLTHGHQLSLLSPKISLDAKSADGDKVDVKLNTKRLYPGKIYADVPEDLKGSFVALQSEGSYQLSSKEANFDTRLKGFKYQDHILFTNRFSFHLKGDDLTLSPMVLQSDKFKLTLEAKKVGDKIRASVKNRALNAHADIRIEPLYVAAQGEISSLKKLLLEVDKVYPVDTSLELDGKVRFEAKMEGEKVRADIVSDKISLPQGRIEKLHILARYLPGHVRISNFDFDLAGFKGKGMNRHVGLAHEGRVDFEGEDARIDFELQDLLLFKGEKKGDVTTGVFKTDGLALAYPGYGSSKITTDLQMYESGGKTAVTGEIHLKETEVTYTSRFLDISKDKDIIIVSKKDKAAKEKDTFLQDMFLDVHLISDDEILYKVDAGEIELKPDMRIRKDFGHTQKITGKLKILDGTYDYADKRFKLEEGAVAFRGLEEVNPLLDLHVLYDEIDDVLIRIKIGGDKNRPKLVFSSEPQMSKKDIFSYLLFGMSTKESEGAATSANKAAERIFGRAISKDLARELHLDRLDMNRNSDGGIDVKAGKKVKRGTIVYYQNKSTESSVIVEHKISKSWEIDTEVGKRGQSVDLVFKKGFK